MNEEKLQKKEVQPRIINGKLLLPMTNGTLHEIDLYKLQEICEWDVDVMIKDVILSIAQISCTLLESRNGCNFNSMEGYFPNPESLYLLSLIQDAFKE